MKGPKKSIGLALKRRRKEVGYSNQTALGVAIGADQPTVARWESGTYFPSDEYIEKLKSILRVDDSFFFGLEEEESSKVSDLEARLARLESAQSHSETPSLTQEESDWLAVLHRATKDQREMILGFARNLAGPSVAKTLSKLKSR